MNPRAHALAWLPNALTLGRLALAPVAAIGWWLWSGDEHRGWLWLGALAFALAALSDLLDGWLARRLEAQSAFGAWLDPIADKALVGLVLLAFAASPVFAPWGWLVALFGFVIIARDVAVTGLRSAGINAPVTIAAKWKTAAEMLALGAAYALAVGGLLPAQTEIGVRALGLWLGLLWLAAALSVFTGWGYLARAHRSKGLRP